MTDKGESWTGTGRRRREQIWFRKFREVRVESGWRGKVVGEDSKWKKRNLEVFLKEVKY